MIKASGKAKETSRGTGRVCFTLGLNLGSREPNEEHVRAPRSAVLTKTIAGSSKQAARGRTRVASFPPRRAQHAPWASPARPVEHKLSRREEESRLSPGISKGSGPVGNTRSRLCCSLVLGTKGARAAVPAEQESGISNGAPWKWASANGQEAKGWSEMSSVDPSLDHHGVALARRWPGVGWGLAC